MTSYSPQQSRNPFFQPPVSVASGFLEDKAVSTSTTLSPLEVKRLSVMAMKLFTKACRSTGERKGWRLNMGRLWGFLWGFYGISWIFMGYMVVSMVTGVPLYRWMVYFMENFNLKWMIRRYSHFWKPPYGDDKNFMEIFMGL